MVNPDATIKDVLNYIFSSCCLIIFRLVCKSHSRVESSLDLLNARVRVESRVAGRDVKSSRKSSQYAMNITRRSRRVGTAFY